MPWSNQSGGGGGPWGQKRPSGPWGGGGPSSGGPGGTPPDLEDLIRRSQDKLKTILPGGAMGGRGIALIVLGAAALWLATGFYTVRPDEVGINLIFGKPVSQSQPGWSYNFPYPVGQVIKPKVTTVNTTEVGFRGSEAMRRNVTRDVLEESLMLTGDENIVDIDFAVQWQINPAKAIRLEDRGTLKPGTLGDATVLDIEQGEFTLKDAVGETMKTDRHLACRGIVLGGKWWHDGG